MMTASDLTPIRQHGFTLLEVAIVLMIVGLLLGGLLVPLSAQMEQRNINDTQKSLAEIKEALIGYALTYGRLPCPAAPNTTGVESPVGGGACTNFYNGFVPATTLGLGGTDSAGYAVDAWGNRIRYAVTSWNSNTFTKPNGMSTVGITNLQPTSLDVCSSATGISSSSCGSVYWLTSSTMGVPAVIFSTGKNGGQGSAGTDEAVNLHNSPYANYQTFVSHLPTASGSANGYFDDIVIWISPNVLVNRMVSAGKLP
jgi:prepilin-type N-terminal cleavage/methylation domain-containing protein